AKRGETITFFSTGVGPYKLPVLDGFPLPASPAYTLADSVKVLAQTPTTITGPAPVPVTRTPQSVVGAAGMVGIVAVQFTLDANLPAGNMLEIYLSVPQTVGSTTSPNESNRVQLPVQ